MGLNQPRFYCNPIPRVGESVKLDSGESRHLSGPRRHRPGDQVALFDGQGSTGVAEVEEIKGRGAEVTLRVEKRHQESEPVPPLVLAAALPSRERVGVMLDMATQIGMSDFIPLVSERSGKLHQTPPTERWQRLFIEASKQSRRAWVPKLHPPLALNEVVIWAKSRQLKLLLAHPGGGSFELCREQGVSPEVVIVGPEGGFTDAEIDAVRSEGVQTIGLGRTILRVETAAIAMLTLVGRGLSFSREVIESAGTDP